MFPTFINLACGELTGRVFFFLLPASTRLTLSVAKFCFHVGRWPIVQMVHVVCSDPGLEVVLLRSHFNHPRFCRCCLCEPSKGPKFGVLKSTFLAFSCGRRAACTVWMWLLRTKGILGHTMPLSPWSRPLLKNGRFGYTCCEMVGVFTEHL